jgi:hypothetical protein
VFKKALDPFYSYNIDVVFQLTYAKSEITSLNHPIPSLVIIDNTTGFYAMIE